MKKLIICIVALCAIFNLSAQSKGEKYLGGVLGISTTSLISGGESVSAIKFAIAPEFGYFVANNFKIGASLGYGIESGTHTLEIMPNIEYYVKLCESFYYTPGLAFGFVAGFAEGIAMPGFGVALNLGSFEFRPTQKFGLSIGLLSFSYAHLTYREKYDGQIYKFSANGVNFNICINPSVGLKYYF